MAYKITKEGIEWKVPTNMWYDPIYPKGSKGWECPLCGRGNAPSIKECPCFKEKNRYGRQSSKRS